MSLQPTEIPVLPDLTPRVAPLAEGHGRHRAPKTSAEWYRRLVRRSTGVTPVGKVLPIPPVAEAAPLPTRPASDPYRPGLFKALAAAEQALSLCPVPTSVTVQTGYLHAPAEVKVYVHQDRELTKLHAYHAVLGGELTEDVLGSGQRHHQLHAEVHGVPVQVWTLLDAEAVQA
ncbi:hypothetical protein [Peterkaempfera sp. SMS 1(5)a]|uniref:hypothetical protein n=1 Tax=Peterkaempfera podocarpi TaxID=3232308 RepID=UPI00366C4706